MKTAFTLAEVLITLGVIGVVAAMTLPILVAKYNEKVVVNKLKKFQSTMSQALLMSIADNGAPDNWGLVAGTSKTSEDISVKLLPYLNVSKQCGLEGGCFYNKDIMFMNGNRWTNLFKKQNWGPETFILSDGSFVATNVIDANCSSVRGTSKSLQNVCAFLYIDINGSNEPNIFGHDVFSFYITKYSLVPTGTVDEFATNHSFTNNCIGENANGMGCTAWIIQNENMDYLHCKDLSWTGKYKCK